MKLRRLTSSGLTRMGQFLDSLTSGAPEPYPNSLLIDSETSESVTPEIEIESRIFENRFDAAQYLHEKFDGKNISGIEKDKFLWAWLALFYFDQLCPADEHGNRNPKQRERMIPNFIDSRRYYRHLLAGPYFIFHTHRDDPRRALGLLHGPVYQHGEVAEQIAAYQDFVTNKAVVEIATSLYLKPGTAKLKRGAGGKGDGSPRRLSEVLNQFDITWDLSAIPAPDLLALLPTEFERFKTV